MKYTITILAFLWVSFVTAQQYQFVPVNPSLVEAALNFNNASIGGFTHDQAGNIFVAMVSSSGSTTVLCQHAITESVDTFPGAASLHSSATGLYINNFTQQLYMSGGTASSPPDSNMWVSSLTAPMIHFVSGSPYGLPFPYLSSIDNIVFEDSAVFLGGSFDLVDGDTMPNFVQYNSVTGNFTQSQAFRELYESFGLTGQVQLSRVSEQGAVTLCAPSSPGHATTVFSFPLNGFDSINVPLPAEYPAIVSALYYKGDLYVTADNSSFSALSIFRLRQGHAIETLATLAGGTYIPADTFNGKIMFVVGTPRYDSISGQIFGPLMSFDSVSFATVVSSVEDSINHVPYIADFRGGIISGSFTSLNGISAIDMCTLAYVDTASPTVTLIGNVVDTVEKGATYTDAGAVAIDNAGDTIAAVISLNTVDMETLGTYHVQYKATDHWGNIGYSSLRTVVVVAPNGVAQISDPDLRIWATQNRQVMVQNAADNTLMTVYSILGQVVGTTTFDQNTSLDMSSQAAGVYIVDLQSSQGHVSRKVVLQ